jgi:uncharacterized protein
VRKPIYASLLGRDRRAGVCAAISLCLLAGPVLAEGPPTGAAPEVGSVWWSEIVSADPVRSRDFYSSVFGWVPKIVSADDTSRSPAPGEAEYTVYTYAGAEVAGGAASEAKTSNEIRPGWINYIQVADVDVAVMEAVKKGGKLVKPPYDESVNGRFAVIQDPEGLVIGLVTPNAKPSTQ